MLSKGCASEDQELGVISSADSAGRIEIRVDKGPAMKRRSKLTIAHRHSNRCRPRCYGALRAGQVLAEIAERNRLLRLQGIRGLVGGLFCANRRSAQGDRRESHHDQGVQRRRSRQWPSFPGWLDHREAPVEAEEKHRGSLRGGCARRLYPGVR